MSYLDSIANISDAISSLNRLPENYQPIKLRNYRDADYQYEILCNDIKEFENSLNDNQEVALKLASFGQSITLNVTNIGY